MSFHMTFTRFFIYSTKDFCQSDFYFSISLSSSLTIPGFAFPFIAFMICPTSAPSAFSFPPLKSSTAFGFFAITSSASVRSAPSVSYTHLTLPTTILV